MIDKSVIQSLNTTLNAHLAEKQSGEELQNNLAAYLNLLITSDFNKLISLLYRLDIDESKTRLAMQINPGTDTGQILAKLVIERQIQKMETRKKPGKDPGQTIDENEKW
jgi:hypothetical protein